MQRLNIKKWMRSKDILKLIKRWHSCFVVLMKSLILLRCFIIPWKITYANDTGIIFKKRAKIRPIWIIQRSIFTFSILFLTLYCANNFWAFKDHILETVMKKMTQAPKNVICKKIIILVNLAWDSSNYYSEESHFDKVSWK